MKNSMLEQNATYKVITKNYKLEINHLITNKRETWIDTLRWIWHTERLDRGEADLIIA